MVNALRLLLISLSINLEMMKTVSGLNAIFLSRLSHLDQYNHFQSLVKNEFDIKRIIYVPTAQYCLDQRLSRPIGEQRRRAR